MGTEADPIMMTYDEAIAENKVKLKEQVKQKPLRMKSLFPKVPMTDQEKVDGLMEMVAQFHRDGMVDEAKNSYNLISKHYQDSTAKIPPFPKE